MGAGAPASQLPSVPFDRPLESPIRLSENLISRRPVSSCLSVWLPGGGGLTLFSPVDLLEV